MYFEACRGKGLHNCFSRRLRRKPPGVPGTETAFWCLFCFREGKCLCSDQVYTVNFFPEKPLLCTFQAACGWRVEGTPSIICSKWHLQPELWADTHLTQKESDAGPISFDIDFAIIAPGITPELISICVVQPSAVSCLLNCYLRYF